MRKLISWAIPISYIPQVKWCVIPVYIPACRISLISPLTPRHEDPKVLDQVLAIVKSCADRTWAGCTCQVEKAWNRDTVVLG